MKGVLVYDLVTLGTILLYYIVWPHMEYAAPVWDPHLRKDQDLFESTQKFASKMITRKWDKGYDELLNMTNLGRANIYNIPGV